MTPGSVVDSAARSVFRAGGRLATMVAKRLVVRSQLREIADDLERVVSELREVAR